MPITIEKKKTGPEPLPGYEEADPLPLVHPRKEPQRIPWWVVFSYLVPPATTNMCMEKEPFKIRVSTMIPFKGYRLSVDPDIARHFRICDIQVGRNSYSINGHQGAAATLFPPLPDKLTPEERADYEELLKLNLDTAQISQTMSLSVINTSKVKRHFSAILWGFGVE